MRCVAFDIVQNRVSTKKEVNCTTYKKDPTDFYVGNGKIDTELREEYHCYVRKEFWT